MPAVNFELMRRQMIKLGGAPNQVVFWSRPVGWKNQTLTPNPDTIYFMPFFNTKDVGPVVLEIPPADTGTIVGSVDDCWQTAIEDVGPAGADKGDGGRYLILPPDHEGDVPRRLHRVAVADLSVLCAAAVELPQRRRRRHRRRGGVRETRSGVSTFGGGRPAADHIHRRDRCLVRRDDPLRRAVLRCAEPHRADRAVAGPRQGDDRHAENHRHREGTTVRARTTRRDGSSISRPTRRTRGWRTDWKRRTFRRPTSTAAIGTCRPPTRSSRE